MAKQFIRKVKPGGRNIKYDSCGSYWSEEKCFIHGMTVNADNMEKMCWHEI